MRLKFTIAKNALANVIRGGASAIVALALPHFLTKSLSVDRFAAWALMLQVAAYANYLDFGIQTAVARYLARAIERGDRDECQRLVNTAFALLAAAGILALSGLGIVVWQLPALFHSIPAYLAAELRMGLLILAGSAAIQLPLSTFTGVLVGMQRNEFPALAIGSTRLAGAFGAIVIVRHSQSLVLLAACVAIFNIIGAVAQQVISKRLMPDLRLRAYLISRKIGAELARYCSTLTAWSFGMLLVSGLDLTIVGFFQFQAVGYYSIAATLIAFVSGLNFAAFNAMMAPVAVLQERRQYARISDLVIATTKLSSYANIALCLIAVLFGKVLLRWWVGSAYVSSAYPILVLLVVAQAVRLVGNAYGTVLVATGLQRYGVFATLIEGFLNLILSIFGMVVIGPAGVAWATLVAAIVAIGVVVFAVMGRAAVRVNQRKFISEGILLPALAFCPVAAWMISRPWLPTVLPSGRALPAMLLASAMAVTIFLVSRGVAGLHLLSTKKA